MSTLNVSRYFGYPASHVCLLRPSWAYLIQYTTFKGIHFKIAERNRNPDQFQQYAQTYSAGKENIITETIWDRHQCSLISFMERLRICRHKMTYILSLLLVLQDYQRHTVACISQIRNNLQQQKADASLLQGTVPWSFPKIKALHACISWVWNKITGII